MNAFRTGVAHSGAITLFALSALSCARDSEAAKSRAELQIDIKNREGTVVGQLSLADVDEGVRFVGWARNLPPGQNSIRLRRGAVCEQLPETKGSADAEIADLGVVTNEAGIAAEIAKTVPDVSVESLKAGAGTSVIVGPADDAGAVRELLACGVIGGM